MRTRGAPSHQAEERNQYFYLQMKDSAHHHIFQELNHTIQLLFYNNLDQYICNLQINIFYQFMTASNIKDFTTYKISNLTYFSVIFPHGFPL